MMIRLKFDPTMDRLDAMRQGATAKQVNTIFRFAGMEAGYYWINNYLHLHFEPQAYQRYGYARRSFRWNRKKQNAVKAYSPNTGREYPAPKPPKPLVWTGEMRDRVLSRKNSYQVKATAKFASDDRRQVVNIRIPIPLPHPINPKNRGELTKLAMSEWRKMRSIVNQVAKKRLRSLLANIIKRKNPGRLAA